MSGSSSSSSSSSGAVAARSHVTATGELPGNSAGLSLHGCPLHVDIRQHLQADPDEVLLLLTQLTAVDPQLTQLTAVDHPAEHQLTAV